MKQDENAFNWEQLAVKRVLKPGSFVLVKNKRTLLETSFGCDISKDYDFPNYNSYTPQTAFSSIHKGKTFDGKNYLVLNKRLAVLVSYETFEHDRRDYYLNRSFSVVGYMLRVIYDNTMYTIKVNSNEELEKDFDFFTLNSNNEETEQEAWLVNHYKARGTLFRTVRDFYARNGDSSRSLEKCKQLPRRGDGFDSTYVKYGTMIVGNGVKISAGRRFFAFNFFVGGKLCWIELEEKNKKSAKNFFTFFNSVEGRTPYEVATLKNE